MSTFAANKQLTAADKWDHVKLFAKKVIRNYSYSYVDWKRGIYTPVSTMKKSYFERRTTIGHTSIAYRVIAARIGNYRRLKSRH